jgi:hypothetical protein
VWGTDPRASHMRHRAWAQSTGSMLKPEDSGEAMQCSAQNEIKGIKK